jgi:hypothetical protein
MYLTHCAYNGYRVSSGIQLSSGLLKGKSKDGSLSMDKVIVLPEFKAGNITGFFADLEIARVCAWVGP